MLVNCNQLNCNKMASLTGLKLFRGHVIIGLASKLNNRPKKVPHRVVYYYRFVTQLHCLRKIDGLRSAEASNLDQKSTLGARIYTDTNPSPSILNQLNNEEQATQTGKEATNNDISAMSRDTEKLMVESSIINDYSAETRLTVSLGEFNENYYVYRHVHRRLNKYVDLANMITKLPIKAQIDQLNQLIKDKPNISDEDYSNTLKDLMKTIDQRIKYMNQLELAVVLTAIRDYDSIEYRTFKRLIDLELRWLVKKHVKTRLMDIDLWFYLADVFYESLIKSRFAHVFVNYFATEREVELTNKQFLHLLFLVILKRDQFQILLNYEKRIKRLLHDRSISFEDIVTICMAYFKTKTFIKNPDILARIVDLTTEKLSSIDPKQPGYCSVIKSVRYSSQCIQCRPNVSHLIMTFVNDPHLAKSLMLASSFNAIQTVKLMEAYRIYQPKLLDLVTKSISSSPNDYRIKDIQYALTSLSNFGYNDLIIDSNFRKMLDNLCDSIMSESRSDAQHQYYHILPILRAFSILGYYNNEFIKYTNKIISEDDKLEKMRSVLEFTRSALLVYTATRIEGSGEVLNHEGHFYEGLSKSIDHLGNMGSVRPDSSLKHLDFILRGPGELKYYFISQKVRTLSKLISDNKLFNDSSYKFNFQYTFPHQNYADLIISKGCCEPGSYDPSTLEAKKVPAHERHCLILAITKHDYIDGYKRLSGYKRLVTRLLTKLGYYVIHLDIDEPDVEDLAHRVKCILNKQTA